MHTFTSGPITAEITPYDHISSCTRSRWVMVRVSIRPGRDGYPSTWTFFANLWISETANRYNRYSFGCASGPAAEWDHYHYAVAKARAPGGEGGGRRPLKHWAALTAEVLRLLQNQGTE
ncbi:MAG: hypothetical protein HOP09_14560 [Hyphomicrobium sp.]|nr:hypothetical protein [Hyphomicrobium sp.]